MSCPLRLLPLLLLFLSQLVPAQSSLAITGDIPKPITLTSDDLAALPHHSVTAKDHDGTSASYEGVDLIEILKSAGAPSGAKLKGPALASYVLAIARDGYRVTFSLGELDPAIHLSSVVVADKRDGKPLSAQDGPLRIVAATDNKPARSVRMLKELHIVLLRPEAPAPN